MSKSNKLRKVNKADGPKKRGKKAMRKSRRVDSKQIVEESIPMSKINIFDNASAWLDDEPWRKW